MKNQEQHLINKVQSKTTTEKSDSATPVKHRLNLSFAARHPVVTFFILAIAYSWSLWGFLLVIALGGLESGRISGFQQGLLALLGFLGGTGSSVMGITLTRAIDGRGSLKTVFAQLKKWRLSMTSAVIAIFTTPILLTLTMLILASFVSPEFLPGILATNDLGGLLAFGLVLGIVAGLVEEFGWTGFALPRLQTKYSPLASGLIIGVVWGTWHFMGDFWGKSTAFGLLYVPNFVVFIAMVTAYRILMVRVYNEANRSLLIAIIMHASFSGSQFILIPAFPNVVNGLIVNAVFAAFLWLTVAFVIAKSGTRFHVVNIQENEETDRDFSIELKSNKNLTRISASNDTNKGVLMEGTLGKLQHAAFIDNIILEVEGSNGTLRLNLRREELGEFSTGKSGTN